MKKKETTETAIETTASAIAGYGHLRYNNEILKALCKYYNVGVRRLMSVNGQTNPNYTQRWLAGGDLRINSLANICSLLRFDLLQFFTYDGYQFKTSLENLYRAERAGIDINAMLMERGIEVYNERVVQHDPAALRLDSREDIDAMVDAAMENYNRTLRENGVLSVSGILQRISEIRDDNETEYKRNVETVKENMQRVIDNKDATIDLLKSELERLRKKVEKTEKSVP